MGGCRAKLFLRSLFNHSSAMKAPWTRFYQKISSRPKLQPHAINCSHMLPIKIPRFSLFNRQRGAIARIQANFDAAPSGCIILAGDSHAAYTLRPIFPRPVLNAGIGGSTVRSYAQTLALLKSPLPASLSVLLIGTNDIRCGRSLSRSKVDYFTNCARRVIDRLKNCSIDVLISALPPTPPSRKAEREPLAVEVYSEILRKLADDLSVGFFDPFNHFRTSQFGCSEDCHFIDGTHLRSYDDFGFVVGEYIRMRYRLDIFSESQFPGFDEQYYKAWYPDTASYPAGPAKHYFDIGWLEGRDPCAHFSSDGYLLANPDVIDRKINPLVHYLDVGFVQGRAGWQKLQPEPTLYGGIARSALIVEAQKHLFERQLRRGRSGMASSLRD